MTNDMAVSERNPDFWAAPEPNPSSTSWLSETVRSPFRGRTIRDSSRSIRITRLLVSVLRMGGDQLLFPMRTQLPLTFESAGQGSTDRTETIARSKRQKPLSRRRLISLLIVGQYIATSLVVASHRSSARISLIGSLHSTFLVR